MSELGDRPFQMIISDNGTVSIREIKSLQVTATGTTWTFHDVTRKPNKTVTSGVEKDGAIVVTTYEGDKQTDRRVIRGAKADE